MKLLCAALLVILGHQALTKSRGVEHQPSNLKPEPVENPTGIPEADKGNPKVTTGKPWVIEPWNENIVLLDSQTQLNPKKDQMLLKLQSTAVENLKDQVDISEEKRKRESRQGCGGEISHTSRSFNHPNDGGSYQNFEDCTWIIRAGQPIKIYFTRFQVEDNYDFLIIRDGDNSGSSVLGRLTGHTIPITVLTSGNAAYLRFTSDHSYSFTGFEIHWEPLGCGEEYTTSNGVISHPLNGGSYGNDENCTWKIKAAETIKITFHRFGLERNYDFLYLRYGDNSTSYLHGKYTENNLPSSLILPSQTYLLLHFTSDNSYTSTGFELHWEPFPKDGPEIVYKYTKDYDLVWNDKGSGGDQDISIWRAKNFENGYYSIGDVAHDTYGRPNIHTLMVSAKTLGVLAPPDSFTRIYIDSGNGAHMYLGVYRMNAPSGYTCLGGVTMGNHYQMPDKNRYRCIRNHYTVPGNNEFLYNDKGTGADSDLSLWSVQRGAYVHGIEGGNFVPNGNWGRPANGYLLKEDGINVRNERSIPFDNVKPLNLHELSDIKEIWNDKGSGADRDVSIWRAETREGYSSIGDIVVGTWDKPLTAFVLTLSDPDDRESLRPPTSYQEIWNDKGSGADRDVTIWRPICPGGYVALGNVATDVYGTHPDVKAFYCVKHNYVVSGRTDSTNWEKVWADHGSGAHKDVKCYEVVGASDIQQRSRGFGAIASYSGYPGPTPYLLNTVHINYIAEPPIERIEVFNVNYETDTARILTNPGTLRPTVIRNNSNRPQTVIREITFSYTTSKTWGNSLAVGLGVSFKYAFGVPAVSNKEITISAEVSYTNTNGGSKTETYQDKLRAEINLPGNSQTTASISSNEYKTDISYTADIKKYYYDGTYSTGIMSGIYKGVDVAEFLVVYGEIESING